MPGKGFVGVVRLRFLLPLEELGVREMLVLELLGDELRLPAEVDEDEERESDERFWRSVSCCECR